MMHSCQSIMELYVSSLQSNEVGGSYYMELEGLTRSMNYLLGENLSIGTLITDRHRAIGKWIRTALPTTEHVYDVWHIAKGMYTHMHNVYVTLNVSVHVFLHWNIGLKKKLVALSKERDCALVGEWIRSIINHLYWCASSTPDGNGDIIVAKWISVVNHIRNRHTRHGKLFPKCLHAKYRRRQGQAVKWMKQGRQ